MTLVDEIITLQNCYPCCHLSNCLYYCIRVISNISLPCALNLTWTYSAVTYCRSYWRNEIKMETSADETSPETRKRHRQLQMYDICRKKKKKKRDNNEGSVNLWTAVTVLTVEANSASFFIFTRHCVPAVINNTGTIPRFDEAWQKSRRFIYNIWNISSP